METWAILVLVIGLNIITVLSSYFLTKMQVSHSDRRFEKGLESQREADYRQRRREVRGEPLLKLRAELASMATKQDRIVTAARRQRNAIGTAPEEEAEKELQEAMGVWGTYIKNGALKQTSLLQCDKELVNKVQEVIEVYSVSYANVMDGEEPKETWPKVIEVQELISKRLEEL